MARNAFSTDQCPSFVRGAPVRVAIFSIARKGIRGVPSLINKEGETQCGNWISAQWSGNYSFDLRHTVLRFHYFVAAAAYERCDVVNLHTNTVSTFLWALPLPLLLSLSCSRKNTTTQQQDAGIVNFLLRQPNTHCRNDSWVSRLGLFKQEPSLDNLIVVWRSWSQSRKCLSIRLKLH